VTDSKSGIADEDNPPTVGKLLVVGVTVIVALPLMVT